MHELERVWYRRGARSWRVLARRGALGVLLTVPLVAAGIAVAVAMSIDTSVVNRVSIVLGAALLGLAAGPVMDLLLEHFDRSYARGARRYEIWATWRGRPVLLLATDDALRFGQTYRALERAIESRPPRLPRA